MCYLACEQQISTITNACLMHMKSTRGWHLRGVMTYTSLIADSARGHECSTWPLWATFLKTCFAYCCMSPVILFCAFALLVAQSQPTSSYRRLHPKCLSVKVGSKLPLLLWVGRVVLHGHCFGLPGVLLVPYESRLEHLQIKSSITLV